MIGCIRCHGPLDSDGNCLFCDAPSTMEEILAQQAKRPGLRPPSLEERRQAEFDELFAKP